MSNTSLLGSYGGLGNAGLQFRNKLINGGFDIWQRGTSQTSSGYGSDDRWLNLNNGSTKTASQQAFALGQTEVPGNPKYFSRTVVSSVAGIGNSVTKHQKMESVNTLAGQTATLSFWAKADAPKNMAVEFYQEFGSGGSPSSAVSGISVTTIALTTAWKYYTVTVNIPSISGKTIGTNNNDNLQIVFWFDAGSNFNARTNSLGNQSGTFDIAQVQLEAGPVATPFEHRPYGLELSLAQRYFCNVGLSNMYYSSIATSTTQVRGMLPALNLRATPVISLPQSVTFRWYSSAGLFDSTGATVTYYDKSDSHVTVVVSGFTGLTSGSPGILAGGASIFLSAEL